MNESIVSIIVPVYNTVLFLDKCVSSILSQTYSNIELILVDDASTDGSNVLCDRWQVQDERIQVIHNERNKGAAFSKNRGLDVASGKYLCLIDSDDWIEPDMIEKMLLLLEKYNVDIVETPLYKIQSEHTEHTFEVKNTDELEVLNTKSALMELMQNRKLHQTPCNKLYKRNIVADIRFPVGRYIDDEFWTYKVFAKAKYILYYDHVFYYYRQHSLSTMGRKFNIGRLDAIDALQERYIFMERFFPELSIYAYDSFCCICRYLLQCLYYYHSDIKDYKRLGNEIVKRIEEISLKNKIKLVRNNNLKQGLWMLLFFFAPISTVRLRNILKIGL